MIACGLALGLLVLGRGGNSAVAVQEGAAATQPAAMKFTKYHFVLLRRAETPPAVSREELNRLMAGHLGHLTKVFEEGHCFVAGPFGNRFDEQWRGMCLYDGDLTAEQVRELAEADPSVEAGLMTVEIMDWHTTEGALAFPLFEQAQAKREQGN